MERYDSYKDSGVEWIGQIPSDWECIRLGMLGDFSSSGIDKKSNEDETPVRMVNYTDIIQSRKYYPIQTGEKEYMRVTTPQSKFEEHKLERGDMVFIPSSETHEDLGYSSLIDFDEEDIVYSYHILRYKTKKPVFHYYKKYLINHHSVLNQFSSECKGTTRQIIGRDVFNNVRVVLPPISEQQQIVSFLDTKTSLIDSLIEKTQRKIELLREGIISYMFYKSSTNYYQDYWFQNIPDGWKILKFREVFEDIVDKGHTDERLLSVHQIKGVIYRDEQEQSVMNPSGDLSNYKLIKEGDFVISLRSSEGGFEFSQVRGLVSPVYTVLRPKFKIDTVLFKYLFKSENFIQEINRYITGIREGKTINYKDIRDIPIPIPDNFQESVVSKHLKILELFDLWEKRNNKLKEYRQSLISEVVTGKRKVVE